MIVQLGEGINYRSLDPAVLCHVYEQALVDDDTRRELGIYYTPPGLAQRMLANLPVEFIDPTERYVLDPTCGSGTLLIAAHERLSALQPSGWSLDARHRDLQVLLHGNDIDPFASEIARLSLLLKAQPAGNGWSITTADTLQLEAPAVEPRIIVMNPPWGYTAEDGERVQRADEFMQRAIRYLSPGGLLGAVVPTSWLSADNSEDTRELLSEQFDVFELWRLPEGTFATASQAASVLLARRKDRADNGGSRVVRQVWKRELASFLEGEPPISNFTLMHGSSPLHEVLPPLELSQPHHRLDEIALVRSGPRRLARFQAGAPRDTPTSDEGRNVLFVAQFRGVKPYANVGLAKLGQRRYPDDFEGNWAKDIVHAKKVLVSAARSANSPWRLRVAVDTQGVACNNRVRGVAPIDQDDDDLLFTLMAILGSGLASAFVACHGIDRNIPARLMHEFPVPSSRRTIRRLGELGRSASRNAHEAGHLAGILEEIETEV